jgi:hypothetical protein
VFLKTVQYQKPKTVERKTLVVQRIKSDWPTGSQTQLSKIASTGLAVVCKILDDWCHCAAEIPRPAASGRETISRLVDAVKTSKPVTKNENEKHDNFTIKTFD